MRRFIIAVAVLAVVAVVGSPAGASERASCPPDLPRSGFSDVYPLSPHAFDIDCIAWRSITDRGVEFHPGDALPRWEMAAWLDATLRWVQDRYAVKETTFVDTIGVPAAESIEAVRKLGVTLGVGGDRFDPYGAVPRWQMALFLTRTYTAAGYELPPPTAQGFGDTAGQSPAAQTAIDQLAGLGITRGTGPDTFSPDAPVTREQMASFVSRLLEEVWVVQPAADSCDTSALPIRCIGERVEVSPPHDLAIRVPMFMFDHIGDLDVAAERLTGARVDLLVDGGPIVTTTTLRRTSGAVYRYWEGTIPAGTRGAVEVEVRTWLRGVLVGVRTVSIEFR